MTRASEILATSADALPGSPVNVLELGWIVVGRLDTVDRGAVHQARSDFLDSMRAELPMFDWRMPLIERIDLPRPIREEPVELLQIGLDERDARHWDFVLVVTGADLIAHHKPFMVAAPSRSLGVGILSTARIDPLAQGLDEDDEQRSRVIATRLTALARQLLGSLCGAEVESTAEPLEDLRKPSHLPPLADEQRAAWIEELQQIADIRLEEESPRARVPFYLSAMWINRVAIWDAIIRAGAWQLPFRLSRLTAGALSALLVLVNTAEVWEVAAGEELVTLISLSLGTLFGTTWYVVKKQRLLARQHNRLTEQAVVTNVSLTLIVALGMLTTYCGVFTLCWLISTLVFPDAVVAGWVGNDASAAARNASVAAFVASLGIVIGALGISFEDEHYFRHTAYVDEEI